MRRVVSAIFGLILCAALAWTPILHPWFDAAAHRAVETNLPAEIDEFSEVDERHEEDHKGSVFDEPTPRSATLFLRLHLAQAERADDPHGSLAHGLRAPPA